MLVFFFFKHKTAYEMRISDWSSDVCSSDLFRRIMGARDFNAGTVGSFREAESHEASATARSWRRATTAAWMPGAQAMTPKAWARGVLKASGAPNEIGRAHV